MARSKRLRHQSLGSFIVNARASGVLGSRTTSSITTQIAFPDHSDSTNDGLYHIAEDDDQLPGTNCPLRLI